MSLKNSLPIFVLTFKLKGGLNQITYLFRFRLVFLDGFSNFSVAWYPLLLGAFSYVILALLNSVLSQYKHEMRLLVIDGSCLIIDGGWLDFESIYRGVLFSFLKGKYVPVFKLKETSEKSVSKSFVSIVVDIRSSLNNLIMSFINLSTLEPFVLCTMAEPLSLSSNNKDFLAWFMVLIIFPSISIKDFAKLTDLSSSPIEIEG